LSLKGAALQSIGGFSEAERAHIKILEMCEEMAGRLQPEEPVFHELGYAQSLLQMHRFEEACARAAHAKTRAVSSGLLQLALVADVLTASSLFGLRRYDEAYACFSQVLSNVQDRKGDKPHLKADLGRLLHHTGKSLLKLGRLNEALDMHRAALRRERSWWTHEALSCALEAQRRPEHLGWQVSSA
jgi:tetratricopeptide (TPR) repeat protein